MYPNLKLIASLGKLSSRYYDEMISKPITRYMYYGELIECVVTEMYTEIEYPSIMHPAHKNNLHENSSKS